MRVSLIAEEVLDTDSDGAGTYTHALIRYLPEHGVAVDPIVAWHTDVELHRAGVSQARRLGSTRQTLYARWARRGKPAVSDGCDLVHATGLAFPWRDSRPVVVTVHDLLWREYPDAHSKRTVELHESALRRLGEASLVICPSAVTAETVRELEYAADRIRVVPNGTDLVRPQDAERDAELDRLKIERPYVLWVGTVEPQRNPEGVVRGFIHAARSWTRAERELKLYLAGPPGWWSADVGKVVEEHGMTDRVRRIQVTRRSYPALYAGAEAFLFPSLAEGFALPVLEAMACGAPVVTSNRSSLPEVAGSAALLCDPTDHEATGEALARVLRDPELAEDLRQLGYRRASDLSWQRTAQQTAACYREALSTTG